jgi:hypothetical protein
MEVNVGDASGTLMKALSIAIVLISLALLFFLLYSLVHNIKLYRYLKRENYNRWRDLTTIRGFGAGGSNPIRFIPYLYSKEDEEDKVILQLKDNIRFGLRHSLVLFLASLIVAAMLVAVARRGWGKG